MKKESNNPITSLVTPLVKKEVEFFGCCGKTQIMLIPTTAKLAAKVRRQKPANPKNLTM